MSSDGNSTYDRNTVAIDPPGDSGGNSTPHTWFQTRRHTGTSNSYSKRQEAKKKRKHNWSIKPQEWDPEMEPDWWFASTGIPLLAATLGPLANVLSIAALVTPWRMCVVQGDGNARECLWSGDRDDLTGDLEGRTFGDPEWCYGLNIASLVLGFVGNFFLLCNFTNRIRYTIALPATIILWYLATGFLIAITAAMEIHAPPTRPQQTYTQGFWYAVLAAIMYLICSMILMVNMLGYFLGHYPDYFTLTESQRTLILQTMLFFAWMAGGAAVFNAVETRYGDGTQPWNFANALYFADVTILTVGFGDLVCTSDVSRGLLFPWSVGGFIMLGLVVASITQFASELGSEKIVGNHIERSRVRTIGRTVATSMELRRKGGVQEDERPDISAPFDPSADGRRIHAPREKEQDPSGNLLTKATKLVTNPTKTTNTPKLILLRNEKDRFNKMRELQAGTQSFKSWYALSISITTFAVLWCLGAVVFWIVETDSQDLTYFQALYFAYVSLLTIGYGDLAPQTNIGRPFFVVWSLLAVPTMTILIGDLGDTLIAKFKTGSNSLADITLLPKVGGFHRIIEKIDWLQSYLQDSKAKKAADARIEAGAESSSDRAPQTIDELATEELSQEELARNLVLALRTAASDLVDEPDKRYSYEEWVKVTKLIRFTAVDENGDVDVEDDYVEWDWLGQDSPMMQSRTEPQFIFDRLSDSMLRYVRKGGPGGVLDPPKRDDEKR
ncbi:hypothetical protein MBLNU230_g5102t1 [Neophaeotheca triangularis]